jgi:hypothetical protein
MEKGGVNRLEVAEGKPDLRRNSDRLRKATLDNIRRLQKKFTIGLVAAALFLLVSVEALSGFAHLPSLPENIRAALGRPPSVNMISALLLLYIFSAIILILSHMMSGSGKYGGVSNVGYLVGFYFFYHFSGKLPENFWAVFVTGVTILGLDGYHIWIVCSEEIEKEREVLADLDAKVGKKCG